MTDQTTPFAALAQAPLSDGRRRKGQLYGSTVTRLRNMIVTGLLAPGMRLNERELRVLRAMASRASSSRFRRGSNRATTMQRAPANAIDAQYLACKISSDPAEDRRTARYARSARHAQPMRKPGDRRTP